MKGVDPHPEEREPGKDGVTRMERGILPGANPEHRRAVEHGKSPPRAKRLFEHDPLDRARHGVEHPERVAFHREHRLQRGGDEHVAADGKGEHRRVLEVRAHGARSTEEFTTSWKLR